ncbi:hypothetical protein DPMN_174214 [Dreissena polymorpha]|uniref:Uncharacterized protein n=1 Tax=Dreissena polymorpha TaxID=45954 RepID=A0A9D4IHN2_DREPO|nr:hypothetical protein DPMN_174214 [Dreissena polymorpha]
MYSPCNTTCAGYNDLPVFTRLCTLLATQRVPDTTTNPCLQDDVLSLQHNVCRIQRLTRVHKTMYSPCNTTCAGYNDLPVFTRRCTLLATQRVQDTTTYPCLQDNVLSLQHNVCRIQRLTRVHKTMYSPCNTKCAGYNDLPVFTRLCTLLATQRVQDTTTYPCSQDDVLSLQHNVCRIQRLTRVHKTMYSPCNTTCAGYNDLPVFTRRCTLLATQRVQDTTTYPCSQDDVLSLQHNVCRIQRLTRVHKTMYSPCNTTCAGYND